MCVFFNLFAVVYNDIAMFTDVTMFNRFIQCTTCAYSVLQVT